MKGKIETLEKLHHDMTRKVLSLQTEVKNLNHNDIIEDLNNKVLDLGKVKEKDTYEEVDENEDQVSLGIFFCFFCFFICDTVYTCFWTPWSLEQKKKQFRHNCFDNMGSNMRKN